MKKSFFGGLRKFSNLCFSRQTKQILFVYFLGESTPRPNCFRFYLTFTKRSPNAGMGI
jgi:hypothetical protein